MNKTTESTAFRMNGVLALALAVGLYAAGVWMMTLGARDEIAPKAAGVLVIVLASLGLSGFTLIQPNEARVVTMLGKYVGTVRESGFYCVLPFTMKRSVSMRIANFISDKLKVNDAHGNPVEIASVIVWQVQNPAQAVLDVQDYKGFVRIQAETALRKIASQFPYDVHGENEPSLRGSTGEVCKALREELQTHLASAGIVVLDAQISHLAYAPEIAQAMLRRQQAQAIIAARMQIVDGAVGMVEMALAELQKNGVVELDEERKAQMVSNLLVVLCGERATQPIVNAGTLY